MANNVTLNSGSGGSSLSTYDDGTAHHQNVRVEFGSTATVVTTTDPLPVAIVPDTDNGADIFRSIDLDETEEEIKASAGQVYGWYLSNESAGDLFVKFYDATAATVVVGTTTPVITVPIGTGQRANVSFPFGIKFATAITVACTTALADADTGAPGANEMVVNIFYK